MKRIHFVLTVVAFVAFAALAQDRTITVREVDVQPASALVTVLPDGGCLLAATANVVAPSIEPAYARGVHAFNGPRCTTVKAAIVAAVKKDLQVGNGVDP